MRNLTTKVLLIFGVLATVFLTTAGILYVKVLPQVVSDEKFITQIETLTKDSLKADLNIEKPVLATHLNSDIEFSVKKISLTKNNQKLLSANDLTLKISLKEIIAKTIILKEFTVKNIYADVNKLMTLSTGEPSEPQKPLPIKIKWFDALIGVDESFVAYSPAKNVFVEVKTKNLQLTKGREPKYLKFSTQVKLKSKNDVVNLSFKDNNNIFVKDYQLTIKDFLINVNNSKININAVFKKNNKYKIDIISKNFDTKNVVQILNTNLVIPNGTEILSMFKDIKGSFNLTFTLTDKNMKGKVSLNQASFKLVPLSDIPVYAKSGNVVFDEKDIELKNFRGWYGSSTFNSIKMDGTIKDYTKSVNMNIKVLTEITNDFAQNYLSKTANVPIELIGNSKTFFLIKSLYNKMDITWLYKVKKGDDILIAGSSFSPRNYDRAIKGKLSLDGNIFKIDEINYYIAKDIDRNHRPQRAIMKFNGSFDLAKNGLLKDFGFEIPQPLPSEFLNLFAGKGTFKGGNFNGDLKYIYNDNNPKIKGELTFEKVRIPSQRLWLRKANLKTDNDFIYINTSGRFKRAKYDLNGKFKNSLTLPIVIKDLNLTVDNLDVERLMASVNAQQNEEEKEKIQKELSEAEEGSQSDNFMFDTNLLIIEKCVFELVKGNYKELKFGNLHADLSLDRNGIFKIHSNRFDFADGISTLRGVFDLKNQNYNLRLGTKDVNSNIIASTLLNLPNEISGKAKALIIIETDKNMKLNGSIKFDISDGNITKLGYVKYLLNFASVFRNPIVMISPSILIDLVNIPEGTFKNISGEISIKNNIIRRMAIKSSSPQLSSFISGRMDLETGDSTIKIFTMFSNKDNGIKGFLKGFSISNLAFLDSNSYNKQTLQNLYQADIEQLPDIEAPERDKQIFLTIVDGDIQRNNFLSSLKKIK